MHLGKGIKLCKIIRKFTCSGARGKAGATLDTAVPTQGLSKICLREAFAPADLGVLELGRPVPG